MRILGIDPGTTVTGYGVVEADGNDVRHIDNGGINPPAKGTLPEKLHHIYSELGRLIATYKPGAVAIENLFVAKNARSSLILGHARGVAMLAASSAGLDIEEYTPSEVKKAVVGTGNASKHQIQQMVKVILNLPEAAFEDASDALAVAICHCNSMGLKKMIDRVS